MSDQRAEGRAYLKAEAIKQRFEEEAMAANFLADNLVQACANMDKLHQELETNCDIIVDEELRLELDPFRRDVKNYTMVLKNILGLEGKHEDIWPGCWFYLNPREKLDEKLDPEMLDKARATLLRVAGYSPKARVFMEQCIADRAAFEEELEQKWLEEMRSAGKKKTTKKKKGFLSKLGF